MLRTSHRLRPVGAAPRRGMALLSAILVIVVLTMLVLGGIFSSIQERRAGRNALVEQRAFAVAEYGLTNEVANWDTGRNISMAVGAIDATNRYVANTDTAFVKVTRLSPVTFWVTSDGKTAMGANSFESRRQTSAYLRLAYPAITPGGAITAAGNVSIRGDAQVRGENSNPPGWTGCPVLAPNAPALMVSPTANVDIQKVGRVTGNPQVARSSAAADSNTYVRYGSETWNSLVANANIVIPGGTIGSGIAPVGTATTCTKSVTNWGEPERPGTVAGCYNYFPIIYSSGDMRINSNGRGQGILLVDGNLELNGNFDFHGIIIVRDNLTRGNGTATVYGAVYVRDATLDDAAYWVGTQEIFYSRCAIESALRGSAVLTRVGQRHWGQLY